MSDLSISLSEEVAEGLLPIPVLAIGDVALLYPELQGEKCFRRIPVMSAWILIMLFKARGRIVSIELMKTFFATRRYARADTSYLMAISRLRGVLKDTSTMVTIETIHNIGYRLKIAW